VNADREHAQQLLNHLAPAPLENEEISEEEERAVAEPREWLKRNKPIPLETVLSEFGLTMADWDTMGKTPLPEENGASIEILRVRHRKDAYR